MSTTGIDDTGEEVDYLVQCFKLPVDRYATQTSALLRDAGAQLQRHQLQFVVQPQVIGRLVKDLADGGNVVVYGRPHQDGVVAVVVVRQFAWIRNASCGQIVGHIAVHLQVEVDVVRPYCTVDAHSA